MLIRILGIVVGLMFVASPFVGVQGSAAWLAPFMGIAFIVYGLGGQRWLAKIAPWWAQKSASDEPRK